jgi:hypothetical protein
LGFERKNSNKYDQNNLTVFLGSWVRQMPLISEHSKKNYFEISPSIQQLKYIDFIVKYYMNKLLSYFTKYVIEKYEIEKYEIEKYEIEKYEMKNISFTEDKQ